MPPAPDLGPRDTQLLVLSEEYALELRSSARLVSRTLVSHADGALYQPELELVWFRSGDRLNVLDLTNEQTAPVTIAQGLPDVDRFSITRQGQLAETEDGCDLAWVGLEWSDTPKIEVQLEPAPRLRLLNPTWLAAQHGRRQRQASKRTELAAPRIELPKKRGDCEVLEDCGSTAAFGATGWQLVLVVEKPGGDCVQRECLLRDPASGLFATPPAAQTWGPLDQAKTGPCGPYMFDRSETSYLVDDKLCTAHGGCHSLGGTALGWLEPGDTVGEPGLGNFDEDE